MSKKTKIEPAFKPVTLKEQTCLPLSPSFLLKLRRRLKRAIKKDLAKTTADSSG
jgi:hypothetical protein